MFRLNIQMFADGEPDVEPTVEPQAEPQAEQQAEPQAEPTDEPKVPSFATIDDYNKHVQSVSSKAKGDILKEIGLDKVADIKEAILKGQSAKEISDELELTKTEREAIKAELEALRSEVTKEKNTKLLNDMGIAPEHGDLFLSLVANDTSELSFQEKAIKVKETIAKMVGVAPKLGTDKTPSVSEEQASNEAIEKLRKIMKV